MALVVVSLTAAPAGVCAEAVASGADASRAADNPFADLVAEAARRFAVPPSWIRAVMRAESAGDVHAVSPKGAIGLMQLMPETYAELRAKHGLGEDPFAPRDNILAGAAYLRELHDRFGTPGFLAAYNVGPNRYEQYLGSGRALPAETCDYLEKLASSAMNDGPPRVSNEDRGSAAWRSSPLFTASFSARSPGDPMSLRPPDGHVSDNGRVADLSALMPLPNGLFPRPDGGAHP